MRLDGSQAAEAVLRSDLPGQPRATRGDFDVVIGAGSVDLLRRGSPTSARFAAALCLSLARTGRLQQALPIAGRRALPLLGDAAGRASNPDQSEGYAAIGEVFLLSGALGDAASCARSAVDYAHGEEAHAFRGLALLAAAQAMNGEFATAAGTIGAARELDRGRGWVHASWPLVLALAQVGFRREDTTDVEEALADLVLVPNAGLVERATCRLGSAWLAASLGDYHAVVAQSGALTLGVDAQQCPRFLLDLAFSIQALAMAQLAQPGEITRLIGRRTSPPGHPVCFELIQASAHLQLGAPHKALAVTEVCVRDCPDHSLRTFPSVLVRRAVAHEMLGHTERADAEYSRAAHLTIELSGLRPLLGVPMEPVKELYLRLLENEPGIRDAVTRRIPETGSYPSPRPLNFDITPLTPREQVLAQWLPTGLTLSAIAAKLSVSPNTVKSQTRSLYRKLGVETRQGAVERLEHTGLTDSLQPFA